MERVASGGIIRGVASGEGLAGPTGPVPTTRSLILLWPSRTRVPEEPQYPSSQLPPCNRRNLCPLNYPVAVLYNEPTIPPILQAPRCLDGLFMPAVPFSA